MNNDVEKRLSNAPLSPPPRSLDDRIRSLTEPPPQPAGWSWHVPAWSAGLACLACFWFGTRFSSPAPAPSPSPNHPSAATPAPSPTTTVHIEIANVAGWESVIDTSHETSDSFFVARK